MPVAADISVIIPTWCRPGALHRTINEILQCEPPPREVIVHIDAGDMDTRIMLDREFKNRGVSCFQSESTQGPGGGRNLLVRKAACSLIASFDDDSWPMQKDYFAKVGRYFDEHQDMAVLTLDAVLRGESRQTPIEGMRKVHFFEGCACVLRREAMMMIAGYLPLRYAYGMEEADVSLQLYDAGWGVYKTDELSVFHDTELAHHVSPELNAAHIRNTALLAFLRYPVTCWPLGALQVLKRVWYAFKVGRYRGILTGLTVIPAACWHYAGERKTVRPETIRSLRRLSKG